MKTGFKSTTLFFAISWLAWHSTDSVISPVCFLFSYELRLAWIIWHKFSKKAWWFYFSDGVDWLKKLSNFLELQVFYERQGYNWILIKKIWRNYLINVCKQWDQMDFNLYKLLALLELQVAPSFWNRRGDPVDWNELVAVFNFGAQIP